LDAGMEPGEYFTGLSLSQFERCSYILNSDYAVLETELKDIKDFSSSDDDLSSSYPSSVFAELNKRKEKYISKSKKKGFIVEKESELNKISLDIIKSIENEKKAEKLDAEFNNIKSEIEELRESLKKAELVEKGVTKLNTIKKLSELKNQCDSIDKKIKSFELDENSINEYLYIGDVLLQNTLTRLRMSEEIKEQSNYSEFKKTEVARKKAIEISELIKTKNEKISLLRVLLEKKVSLKNKLNEKKKNIYLLVSTSILTVLFFILSIVTKHIYLPYMSVISLIINILFIVRHLGINKKLYPLKTSFNDNENSLSIDEITAKLNKSEEKLTFLNTELENLFLENKVNSFDELTEKYYLQKSEYEHSDGEALKNTALESSKKFIIHVNKLFESESFDSAQKNFIDFKDLLAESKRLNKEYNNLLIITENEDKTTYEYKTELDTLNNYLKSTEVLSSQDIKLKEKKISILTERLLDIKSQYPKECISVYELNLAKDNLSKELSELYDTYNAILMTEKTLKESFNEISYGFIPKINEIASSILSELENKSQKELIITDNIIPKIKQDLAGDFVHSAYMSESEKERIYLALRLAITKVIENDNSKLPIIADDILSSYDQFSKERAINFLKKFATDRQLLFFTCHDSVKNIFTNSENIKVLNL